MKILFQIISLIRTSFQPIVLSSDISWEKSIQWLKKGILKNWETPIYVGIIFQSKSEIRF